MPVSVMFVDAAGCHSALAGVVRELKGGNPLAPVSVVVPTNAAGVAARRYLGRNGGIAALDMITLSRLAEVLAGPPLADADRKPVSAPVVELAVRRVLDESPGIFRSVAHHPSTVTALRELHDELRLVGPRGMSRIAAASSRGDAVVAVSRSVTDYLDDRWYDRADLLHQAAQMLATGQTAPTLERLVVFLPHIPHRLELDFLQALTAQGDSRVILLATGNHSVDAEMIELGRCLTEREIDFQAIDDGASVPGEIISVTDADDEVRHAVRRIIDAAKDGVPFGRMALLWSADQPYARLVEHHLDAAGIPWNGRPGVLIEERIVPRFVLDALELDRRGLQRTTLFNLLSDVPLLDGNGEPVPTARWERIARAAGVAEDADWWPRLRSYAERQRRRTIESGDSDSPRAIDAEALLAYVERWRAMLGHPYTRRRWEEWSQWVRTAIGEHLGDDRLTQLPEAERLASDHTQRVLDRLQHLDQVDDTDNNNNGSQIGVTRAEFRAVFAAEFEAAPGRLGRIGHGVTIGSLAGQVGLDVDAVLIVGAADGMMPSPSSPGPLIGDHERAAGGLLPVDTHGRRLHRAFLATIGSKAQSWVSWPRGDLRATTQRHRTRWLDDVADVEPVEVDSLRRGLLDTKFPASFSEFRLRSFLALGDRRLTDDDVIGDEVLSQALKLREARRADTFTVFDGDLSGIEIVHFDRPVSPSRLEAWVGCPHAYFLSYILGVRPVDDPNTELKITPIESGNVLHKTVDRLHHEVLDKKLNQPRHGWTTEHRSRALEIFDEVADEFEQTGRTGRPASWSSERRSLRSELLGWLYADGARLAAHRAEIVSSERSFGDDDAPTALKLDGGRSLAVYGYIDRIDKHVDADGNTTLAVVDHKTGTPNPFKDLTAEDPTAAGTKFQLPVYAAGARAITGDPNATVDARYSMFERGGYEQYGYALTPEVDQRVREAVSYVVDGIESGFFPSSPSEPGFRLWVDCQYCEPDGLGTAERYPEWDRKRHDQRTARWFAPKQDTIENATEAETTS